MTCCCRWSTRSCVNYADLDCLDAPAELLLIDEAIDQLAAEDAQAAQLVNVSHQQQIITAGKWARQRVIRHLAVVS